MNREKFKLALTGFIKDDPGGISFVLFLFIILVILSKALITLIHLSGFFLVILLFLLITYLLIAKGAKKEVDVDEYKKIQDLIATGVIESEDFTNSISDEKLNYYNFYYLLGLVIVKRKEKEKEEERRKCHELKNIMMTVREQDTKSDRYKVND